MAHRGTTPAERKPSDGHGRGSPSGAAPPPDHPVVAAFNALRDELLSHPLVRAGQPRRRPGRGAGGVPEVLEAPARDGGRWGNPAGVDLPRRAEHRQRPAAERVEPQGETDGSGGTHARRPRPRPRHRPGRHRGRRTPPRRHRRPAAGREGGVPPAAERRPHLRADRRGAERPGGHGEDADAGRPHQRSAGCSTRPTPTTRPPDPWPADRTPRTPSPARAGFHPPADRGEVPPMPPCPRLPHPVARPPVRPARPGRGRRGAGPPERVPGVASPPPRRPAG